MNTDTLISAAILVAGLLMLLPSLWYLSKKKAEYRACIETTGTVKALKAVSSSFVNSGADDDLAFRQEENMFKGDSYAPVIAFITEDGTTIEFTGSSSRPARYGIGDKVAILYRVAYPERAVINSFFDKWFLAAFLIAFSIVTIATGGLLLILL